MAGKKEIIFWKFNKKSLEEYFRRVKVIAKLGIEDTRDMRMMILHTMAHQGEIKRYYINGSTRKELEESIKEWVKYHVKRRQNDLSSGNREDNKESIVGRFLRKTWSMVKVFIMGDT